MNAGSSQREPHTIAIEMNAFFLNPPHWFPIFVQVIEQMLMKMDPQQQQQHHISWHLNPHLRDFHLYILFSTSWNYRELCFVQPHRYLRWLLAGYIYSRVGKVELNRGGRQFVIWILRIWQNISFYSSFEDRIVDILGHFLFVFYKQWWPAAFCASSHS